MQKTKLEQILEEQMKFGKEVDEWDQQYDKGKLKKVKSKLHSTENGDQQQQQQRIVVDADASNSELFQQVQQIKKSENRKKAPNEGKLISAIRKKSRNFRPNKLKQRFRPNNNQN